MTETSLHLRRCVQCWRLKPAGAFIGRRGDPIGRCTGCQEKYRAPYGARASDPRRGLPLSLPGPPRVLWSPASGNKKLGGIPACLVSGETCPTSCSFFGDGCFAEFGFLGHHWRETAKNGLSWKDFLARVRELPSGALWRYAVAGDLPGAGDALDVPLLKDLIYANIGRRGFTFTHKPLRTRAEQKAVQKANREGFTVNLSADTLAQADEKAELGIAPVAVVLPVGTTGTVFTPMGRAVLLCRSEAAGLTCRSCQLCARDRAAPIVGFVAHGQMKRRVSELARG